MKKLDVDQTWSNQDKILVWLFFHYCWFFLCSWRRSGCVFKLLESERKQNSLQNDIKTNYARKSINEKVSEVHDGNKITTLFFITKQIKEDYFRSQFKLQWWSQFFVFVYHNYSSFWFPCSHWRACTVKNSLPRINFTSHKHVWFLFSLNFTNPTKYLM